MLCLIFRPSPIFCFSFDMSPDEIKKKGEIKASTFNKENFLIQLKNSGVKPQKSFHRIYCNYCQSNIVPKLIEKYKESLSEDQSLSNLITNWDILKVSNGVINAVGCFSCSKVHTTTNRTSIFCTLFYPKLQYINKWSIAN